MDLDINIDFYLYVIIILHLHLHDLVVFSHQLQYLGSSVLCCILWLRSYFGEMVFSSCVFQFIAWFQRLRWLRHGFYVPGWTAQLQHLPL